MVATAIRIAILPCGKNPPVNSAPNANHRWSMGQKELSNAVIKSACLKKNPPPLPNQPLNKSKRKNIRQYIGCFFVLSARIERASPASEASVLSIERQEHKMLKIAAEVYAEDYIVYIGFWQLPHQMFPELGKAHRQTQV